MKKCELIESFLESSCAERGCSKLTIEAYRRDLISWSEKCSNIKHPQHNEITSYVFDPKTKQTTQRRRLSTLNQFYIFLISEEIISKNPVANVKILKSHRPIPKALTEEEVTNLINAAHNSDKKDMIRLCAIIELIYGSGIRISELVQLKYSEVKLDQNPIIRVMGKGNKERVIPINEMCCDAIRAYIPIRSLWASKSIYLFPSRNSHITRQRVGQILKKLAIKAEIDPGRLSPHVLRHSFATHILKNGANINAVQALLGHQDISTTQIYTKVVHSQFAQTLKLHPLSNLNGKSGK